MVKILVMLCKLAAPTNCQETLATSSDFQPLNMFDCGNQAALADWMKQHPAEFIKSITCQFGTPAKREHA